MGKTLFELLENADLNRHCLSHKNVVVIICFRQFCTPVG